MVDRVLFPARELKDCAIPVLKRHLKEGQGYFFVNHVGEMLSPQIDNVVFVGRPLQSEGDNSLFFQDMQSYGEGARYGGAWQGRPPVFFSCPETHSSDVFEFERALELLLLDYPQRPLSSTFGGGIGAGSADWPKATFGSYTGSEEDTEDTDWEESLSDSDKNIRIVWSEQDHPTRPTDPTDEEEQACLAKIPSIHFEARELNPNPEPMTAGSLREGSIYFPVSYADDTRLVPMMKAVVYAGQDIAESGNVLYRFQDVNTYEMGVQFGSEIEPGELYSAEDWEELPPPGCEIPYEPIIFWSRTEEDLEDIFDYKGAVEEWMRCSLRRKAAAE